MNLRMNKLLRKMEEAKLDALLIGSRPNRLYMSGFTGSSGMVYISHKKQVLITDFRYMEQVSTQCQDFEVVNQGSSGLIQAAVKIAKEDGARYIGFESAHTNYTTYLTFKEHEGLEWIPTQNIVEGLRQIKDSDEISSLKKAEQIGDLAFSHIISFIKENYRNGLTENDVALELENIMKKKGAGSLSFPAIVAAGAKSSLPHAEPGNDKLKIGDLVVLDFGCVYEGYCSDMTRTLVIGEPTKKQKLVYDTVLQAQLAALQMIKPGLKGQEVDHAARRIIEEAGFGENFGHGLGHSVGLEIHESPRLSPLDATVLEAGMAVTVEPGIYISGFGGVRIEDLVVLTECGYENLTYSSKELIVIA